MNTVKNNNDRINLGFLAEGEVFGLKSTAGIVHLDGNLTVMGTLKPGDKGPGDIIREAAPGLASSLQGSTILSGGKGNFSVDFVIKGSEAALLLKTGGLIFGLIISGGNRKIIAALNTSALKNGNNFEKYTANIAEWAHIEKLTFIVQQQPGRTSYRLLEMLGEDGIFLEIPETYAGYQLIAGGVFSTAASAFGKGLKLLTNCDTFTFLVGGNLSEKKFSAAFLSGKIETDICSFESLSFAIAYTGNFLSFSAGGKLILKLKDNPIGFALNGTMSERSFSLSASSLAGTKMYLTQKLFFSDLGLAIAVKGSSLSFGMIGRLTSGSISVFAGFNIAYPPVRVTLLTAALSTSTGKISLKDLVVDFVEINSNGIETLDVIVVKDFDLQNVKLDSPVPAPQDRTMPEENQETPEEKVEEQFNKVIAQEMRIAPGNIRLTPLGSSQYILTDQGRMRHYRINAEGVVSLNCQVFICSEKITMGEYAINPGFFICGVLEIFKVNIRFLFQVEKGVSLIALLQLSPIKIGPVVEITASSKKPPIAPIDGGLAGQLVKPGTGGAIFYLNVSKVSGVSCYFNAVIRVFSLFSFDTMIVIRDKHVYIDTEVAALGFRVFLKLDVEYQKFSDANFGITIGFDTSGFLKMLDKARENMKKAAQAVTDKTNKARQQLTNAQNSVLNLEKQIGDFNNKVQECRAAISRTKWYQVGTKIAKGLEIVYWECRKACVYVEIGVAYAALEIAKAALRLGEAVVNGILGALAYVIQAATQLLWIKNFELSVLANTKTQEVGAKLLLVVMGKEKLFQKTFDLSGLKEKINGFVEANLDSGAKEVEEAANKNTISRSGEDENILREALDGDIFEKSYNLAAANERYKQGRLLMDAADEMLMDMNKARVEVFGEPAPEWREEAARLSLLRTEHDEEYVQTIGGFAPEFMESLETVLETVHKESPQKRASPEFSEMGDNLKAVTKELVQFNTGTSRMGKTESLLSRMDQEIDKCDKSRKARAAEVKPLSAEEANNRMADSIVAALEKHFPDGSGADFTDLKKDADIAAALYQFRNPPDTRKKQKKE